MKPSVVLTTLVAVAAFAQSPPATESRTIGGKGITIAYNSPRVNGRAGKLFGSDGRIAKDPNYPVWRAGANAATKLHTEGTFQFGGLTVPPGDYTLYVDLSDPAAWQLIINKQTGQWGLKYDQGQDLGRVKMTMAKTPTLVENLAYSIADLSGGKGKLTLEWENVSASVNIKAQ